MDIEDLRKMQDTEKALRIHNITDSPQEALDSVSRDIYVGGTRVPSFEEIPTEKKEVSQMDDKAINELKKTVEQQGELIAQQARLIHQLQGVVNDVIRELKKMQGTVPTKNSAERQQMLKAEDKKEHPRSGGYTSDDVSVEKFFYSGPK